MAVYDAIILAGMNPSEMSFSSAVSRVFAMMMDSLRRDKLVPTRDGFEYSTIMETFIQKNKATLPSISYRAPTASIDNRALDTPLINVKPTQSAEQREVNQKYKELMFKREYANDSMSTEDYAELERIEGLLFAE
jgi:hypothetical protein